MLFHEMKCFTNLCQGTSEKKVTHCSGQMPGNATFSYNRLSVLRCTVAYVDDGILQKVLGSQHPVPLANQNVKINILHKQTLTVATMFFSRATVSQPMWKTSWYWMERKHGALHPQKPLRLIRDRAAGGSGIFISNTYSLHCHHQNDSALRWAAVRAILMFH